MIFHIAFKDLKVIYKDKKALIMLLLMPALIMLILGSALGATFTSDVAVKKFSVAVVNKDDGMMSGVFINNVLRDNMSDMFNTYVVSEEKADGMLENKTVPSVIIIPEGFSQNLENHKDVKLLIKSDIDDQMKSSIVNVVVQGFTQNISASYTGAFAAVDTMKKYNMPMPTPPAGMTQATVIMGELQKKLSSEIVSFKEIDQEKTKSVSAIQYYSAAMLIMFLLFSANTATTLMIEERENRTLNRIMSARATKVTLMMGKCLGLLLIGAVQCLILILFTHFIYGVEWGGPIYGVALITLCAIFACSGVGMFIAAVAKTSKSANSIGSVLIQVFTALGGGMIPIYVLPQFIRNLSNITPNWWAMDGYYQLMQGAGIAAVLPNCGILAAMGALFLSIGILKFKMA